MLIFYSRERTCSLGAKSSSKITLEDELLDILYAVGCVLLYFLIFSLFFYVLSPFSYVYRILWTLFLSKLSEFRASSQSPETIRTFAWVYVCILELERSLLRLAVPFPGSFREKKTIEIVHDVICISYFYMLLIRSGLLRQLHVIAVSFIKDYDKEAKHAGIMSPRKPKVLAARPLFW